MRLAAGVVILLRSERSLEGRARYPLAVGFASTTLAQYVVEERDSFM